MVYLCCISLWWHGKLYWTTGLRVQLHPDWSGVYSWHPDVVFSLLKPCFFRGFFRVNFWAKNGLAEQNKSKLQWSQQFIHDILIYFLCSRCFWGLNNWHNKTSNHTPSGGNIALIVPIMSHYTFCCYELCKQYTYIIIVCFATKQVKQKTAYFDPLE